MFRAGQLYCALPLDEVVETMRPLPAQALARTPAYLKGVSILRGVPTPVIDVAVLLGGREAPVERYVAVRTARGPAAFATGEVLGIRATTFDKSPEADELPADAPGGLVSAVGTYESQPLFLLRTADLLPDRLWTVWSAADDR